MRALTGFVVVAGVAATTAVVAPSGGFARPGGHGGGHPPTGVRVAAPPALPTAQNVVVLLKAHSVFAKPSSRRRTGTIPVSRPITRVQTALPVIGRTTTKDGKRWWKVMLPGRPNGRKGWIGRPGTVLTSTKWRLVIRTSSRTLLVYRAGKLVRRFRVVVGKGSTPTPRGRFFVEENVRMPGGAAGGPYALALSARSNVYQEFEGGPGQIGVHGIANLGGTMGTAASNGCVRMTNGSITWLAARITPGTPVTITS